MADHDDDIFAEALAATPVAPVPAGFAERVASRAVAPRAAPWPQRRVAVAAAVLAALAACGVIAWKRRAVSGEINVSILATSPVTLAIGHRGRIVAEPGTRLTYRVGGVFQTDADVVDVARGAVFFRVDTGGALRVRTPHGTVAITGTCFRVAVADRHAEGDGDMERTARARWFGAGVATATLAVIVYEGGVNLASARTHQAVHLSPGQAAAVHADGAIARMEPGANAAPASASAAPVATTATATATAVPSESDAARVREVARLREILVANGISPATGRPEAVAAAGATGDGGAARRSGLDDSGNTDLTPDEWRTLAARGELRYRLPGRGTNDASSVSTAAAEALRLPETDVAEVNAAIVRAHERLMTELRALYREAVGSDAGNLSMQAIQSEIIDKTPADVASAVTWQLSQERAGLAAPPAPRADATPYERMTRLLVGFEAQLERDIAAIIGPANAHALLYGEHPLGAHSYGLSGRQHP